MSSSINDASANELTKIVGQNRMGLLLFHLWNSKITFGINVFKVEGIIPCPKLTKLPKRHKLVIGAVTVRGNTISVIDLTYALTGIPTQDYTKSFLIIAEFNRQVNGILVSRVDRIINISWSEISPPPEGTGNDVYISAVTKFQDNLIEIVDVEKILSEISPLEDELNDVIINIAKSIKDISKYTVMLADDSSLILKQEKKALEKLGLRTISCKNGKIALDKLEELIKKGPIQDQVQLLISDVEMPEMDGYTLCSKIRSNPKLKDLYIIIHTSMSGGFNFGMIRKIGANDFVPKFDANELTSVVMHSLRMVASGAKGTEVEFNISSVEELKESHKKDATE